MAEPAPKKKIDKDPKGKVDDPKSKDKDVDKGKDTGKDSGEGKEKEPKPKRISLRNRADGFTVPVTVKREGRKWKIQSDTQEGRKKGEKVVFTGELNDWYGSDDPDQKWPAPKGAVVTAAVVEHRGTKYLITVSSEKNAKQDMEAFKAMKEEEFVREKRRSKEVEHKNGDVIKEVHLEKAPKSADFKYFGPEKGKTDPEERMFEVHAAFPWPDAMNVPVYVDKEAGADKDHYEGFIKAEVDIATKYQAARAEYFRNKALTHFFDETGKPTGFEDLLKDGDEPKKTFLEAGAKYAKNQLQIDAIFISVVHTFPDIQAAADQKSLNAALKKIDEYLGLIDKQLQEASAALKTMHAQLENPDAIVTAAPPALSEDEKRQAMLDRIMQSGDKFGDDAPAARDVEEFIAAMEGPLKAVGLDALAQEQRGAKYFHRLRDALDKIGVSISADAVFGLTPQDGARLNLPAADNGRTLRFNKETAITDWEVTKRGGGPVVLLTVEGGKQIRLDIQTFIERIESGDVAVVERSQKEADFVNALADGTIPFEKAMLFLTNGEIPGHAEYRRQAIIHDDALFDRVYEAAQANANAHFENVASDELKALLADDDVNFQVLPAQMTGKKPVLGCVIAIGTERTVSLALTGDRAVDAAAAQNAIAEVKERIAERDAEAAAGATPDADTSEPTEPAEPAGVAEQREARQLATEIVNRIKLLDNYAKQPGKPFNEVQNLQGYYARAEGGEQTAAELNRFAFTIQNTQGELTRLHLALSDVGDLTKFSAKAGDTGALERARNVLEETQDFVDNIDANLRALGAPMREREARTELADVEEKLQDAVRKEQSARAALKMYLARPSEQKRDSLQKNYEHVLNKASARVLKLNDRAETLRQDITNPDFGDPAEEKLRLERETAAAQREFDAAKDEFDKYLRESSGKSARNVANDYMAVSYEERFKRADAHMRRLDTEKEQLEEFIRTGHLTEVTGLPVNQLRAHLNKLEAASTNAANIAEELERITETHPLPEAGSEFTVAQWKAYLPKRLKFPDGRRREFEAGTGLGLFAALAREHNLPVEGTPPGLFVTWTMDTGGAYGLEKGAVYKVTPDDEEGGAIISNIIEKSVGGGVNEIELDHIMYYNLLIRAIESGAFAAGSPDGTPPKGPDGSPSDDASVAISGNRFGEMLEYGTTSDVPDVSALLEETTADPGVHVEADVADKMNALVDALRARGFRPADLRNGNLRDVRGRIVTFNLQPDGTARMTRVARNKNEKDNVRSIPVEQIAQMLDRGQVTKFTEAPTVSLDEVRSPVERFSHALAENGVTLQEVLGGEQGYLYDDEGNRLEADILDDDSGLHIRHVNAAGHVVKEETVGFDTYLRRLDRQEQENNIIDRRKLSFDEAFDPNAEVVAAEAAPGDSVEDREQHFLFILGENDIEVSDLTNGSLHDEYDRPVKIYMGNNARARVEYGAVYDTHTPRVDEEVPFEDIEELIEAGQIRVLNESEYPTTEGPAAPEVISAKPEIPIDLSDPNAPEMPMPEYGDQPGLAPLSEDDAAVQLDVNAALMDADISDAERRKRNREANNYNTVIRDEFGLRPSEIRGENSVLYNVRGEQIRAQLYPFGDNPGVRIQGPEGQASVIPYEDFYAAMRGGEMFIDRDGLNAREVNFYARLNDTGLTQEQLDGTDDSNPILDMNGYRVRGRLGDDANYVAVFHLDTEGNILGQYSRTVGIDEFLGRIDMADPSMPVYRNTVTFEAGAFNTDDAISVETVGAEEEYDSEEIGESDGEFVDEGFEALDISDLTQQEQSIMQRLMARGISIADLGSVLDTRSDSKDKNIAPYSVTITENGESVQLTRDGNIAGSVSMEDFLRAIESGVMDTVAKTFQAPVENSPADFEQGIFENITPEQRASFDRARENFDARADVPLEEFLNADTAGWDDATRAQLDQIRELYGDRRFDVTNLNGMVENGAARGQGEWVFKRTPDNRVQAFKVLGRDTRPETRGEIITNPEPEEEFALSEFLNEVLNQRWVPEGYRDYQTPLPQEGPSLQLAEDIEEDEPVNVDGISEPPSENPSDQAA